MPHMIPSVVVHANTNDLPISIEIAEPYATPLAGEVPLCRFVAELRSGHPSFSTEDQASDGSSDIECHASHSDASTITPFSSLDSLPSINDQHTWKPVFEQIASEVILPPGKWAAPAPPPGLEGFAGSARAAAAAASKPLRSSFSHAAPMESPPPLAASAAATAMTYGVDGAAEPAFFAMKLLLSCRESGCIIGECGSQIKQIQQFTGALMHLSGRNEFYPGTSLQELNIQGQSPTAVVAALRCTLDAVIRQRGVLSGGEANVGIGKARLNIVVPKSVAHALVGRSSIAESFRSLSGVQLQLVNQQHTLTSSQPQEMVVRLSGTQEGVNAAMMMIAEKLSRSAGEPWFQAWAFESRCAPFISGNHVRSPDAVDRSAAFDCHKPQNTARQSQCPQHAMGSSNSKFVQRNSKVRAAPPRKDCDRQGFQKQLEGLVRNVSFIQHSHQQMQQAAQSSSRFPAKLAIDSESGDVMSIYERCSF